MTCEINSLGTTSISKGQEEREEEGRGEVRGNLIQLGGGGIYFFFQCFIDDPETALSNGKTIRATNIKFSSNHIFLKSKKKMVK